MAELKEQVVALTSEDRLELAALISHLERKDDPKFLDEIDRRLDAIAAGKKFTKSDLERKHRELNAQGK